MNICDEDSTGAQSGEHIDHKAYDRHSAVTREGITRRKSNDHKKPKQHMRNRRNSKTRQTIYDGCRIVKVMVTSGH